jgi:hypothetical protein
MRASKRIRRVIRGAAITVAVGSLAALVSPAGAADHRDGEAVQVDPASDINDVYSFMDGDKLVLAMTVSPFADANAKFGTATQYVFHVSTHDAFGTTASKSQNIICEFGDGATVDDQDVTCWIGTQEKVSGNASNSTSGLTSDSGKVQLFTGRRKDPFYFYLTGFKAARTAVVNAVKGGAVGLNPNGCPILDQTTANNLRTALVATDQTKNDFKDGNVLTIVLKMDKALFVDADHAFVSVYASTHTKPQ